ncbi:MAG: hypothetical protein FWH33_03105 [Oscillospiraceae bacterium]|nr:hypothetical protein [Oscillospiraceae bacterium]
MLTIAELFEPRNTVAWEHLSRLTYPWEALPIIHDIIMEIGASLDGSEYAMYENDVWIHKTATITPSAFIGNAVIIGAGAEIRHGAFIRENALVGDNTVVGNSTELKNVILFNGVQVPHYNYVGDSILGYKAHMGAGAITSNAKNDHSSISVSYGAGAGDGAARGMGAARLGRGVDGGAGADAGDGTEHALNAAQLGGGGVDGGAGAGAGDGTDSAQFGSGGAGVAGSEQTVNALNEGGRIETGLRKFGAILGDHVEVGCNSVLNPGSVVGKGTLVYPLSNVRGYVPAGCIYKRQGEVVDIIPK